MRITKKIKKYKRKTYKKGGTFEHTFEEKIKHRLNPDPHNLKKYVENVLKPGADVSGFTHEFANKFEITNDEDIEYACIVLYVIMHRVDPNNTFQLPSTFITVETYQEKKKDILDKLKTLTTLNTSEYVKALQSVIELCSIRPTQIQKVLTVAQRGFSDVKSFIRPEQRKYKGRFQFNSNAKSNAKSKKNTPNPILEQNTIAVPVSNLKGVNFSKIFA